MDRTIIYPGQVPLETDLLNTNKNTMVALAKLAAGILGTSNLANGFATSQTVVPSMAVLVQPGEVYSLASIDGTAYGSLAADATHSVLKQGILLDAVTLGTPAPATAGQSINYLVQVSYSDTDSGSVVLPYYNASNPATSYSGPSGTGVAQNTLRKGVATVTVKAGAAATSGSQTTPAPDAGNVGLYVVTVANGVSSVVNANISVYGGAAIMQPAVRPDVTGLVSLGALAVSGAMTKGGSSVQTLANFTTGQTLAAAGEQGMPGGLLMKWGSVSVGDVATGNGTTGAVTFANAFPGACFRVMLTIEDASASVSAAAFVSSKSASGFNWRVQEWGAVAQSATLAWLAFGN